MGVLCIQILMRRWIHTTQKRLDSTIYFAPLSVHQLDRRVVTRQLTSVNIETEGSGRGEGSYFVCSYLDDVEIVSISVDGHLLHVRCFVLSTKLLHMHHYMQHFFWPVFFPSKHFIQLTSNHTSIHYVVIPHEVFWFRGYLPLLRCGHFSVFSQFFATTLRYLSIREGWQDGWIEGWREGWLVGLANGWRLGWVLGCEEGWLVGVRIGWAEHLVESSVAEKVGSKVDLLERQLDGWLVGCRAGLLVGLVGLDVGCPVGVVGILVGWVVGCCVGCLDGCTVGWRLGWPVGWRLVWWVDWRLGWHDGCTLGLANGRRLGWLDGWRVGWHLGWQVGSPAG